MTGLVTIGLLILGIVAVIAFFTALWRTLNDLFVKLIGWFASSLYGAAGLIFLIWLAFKFCNHA